MSRYKTLIFDLDGTLIDTKPGILKSLEHTFDTLAITDRPDPSLFLGPPLPDSFRRFCGMDKQETDEAVRIFRRRYSESELFNAEVFEGIPELLGRLKNCGHRLAVATCKVERYAEAVLKHFGLDGYFDVIGGSVENRTQKRDVIAHVISQLGETVSSRVLMIGDRDNDVSGAMSAGIKCMGVLWGYGSGRELALTGAEFIARTPDHAAEMLLAQ